MGLDATIKRADGKPLGTVAEVEKMLEVAFPGIFFERLPSGAEKIKAKKKASNSPKFSATTLNLRRTSTAQNSTGPISRLIFRLVRQTSCKKLTLHSVGRPLRPRKTLPSSKNASGGLPRILDTCIMG